MLLVAVLTVAFVVVAAFAAATRHRTRLELRADLLDLIAGACRRALPLPPLLHAFAEEAHGRRRGMIETLAERLDAGAPLDEALGALPRRLVPAHVVAAVEAASSTSRLPAVLEAVAADAGESLALRHRFVVAALYPLLLAFLLFGLHTGAVAVFAANLVGYMQPRLSRLLIGAGIGTLVAAGAIFLLLPLLRRLGALPGARRLGSARVLATSALLVEAGLPLDDALRRAAPAGGHGRLARDLWRAVEGLDEGLPPDRVWSSLGLPAVARLRLEAASPANLGRVMGSVAARTFDVWRAHSERLLQWMTPLAVILVGAIVLLDFQVVMDVLADARDSVRVRLW